MSMYGADATALDEAAAQLEAAAAELNSASGGLGGLLSGLAWIGNIASAFVGLWNSDYKPRLGSTASFIEDAARELRRQAAQQRDASNSDGGSARPGGHPGSPFWPSPWRPGDAVLPRVPWGWLGHLNGGLGGLFDAIGFDVNGDLRDLEFGSLWFGAVATAGGMFEDLFRDQGWTEAALAAGFTGVAGNVGSAGLTFLKALEHAPVGKVGPGLMIVGGLSGFISEYNETLDEGAGTGSLIMMGGNLTTAAAGVALMIPGAAPVGGLLAVIGAAEVGTGWVVKNWDDITKSASDTYRAVDNWVDDRVNDAAGAISGIGHAATTFAEDTVEQAGAVLSGGWNKLRSIF